MVGLGLDGCSPGSGKIRVGGGVGVGVGVGFGSTVGVGVAVTAPMNPPNPLMIVGSEKKSSPARSSAAAMERIDLRPGIFSGGCGSSSSSGRRLWSGRTRARSSSTGLNGCSPSSAAACDAPPSATTAQHASRTFSRREKVVEDRMRQR